MFRIDHPGQQRIWALGALTALAQWIALPCVSAEREIEWTFSTGFDYSEGNYKRDQRTQVYFVPLSVGVESHPFSAKLTLPLLGIVGPDGSLPEVQQSAVGGRTDTEVGLGQIVGAVSYFYDPGISMLPYLEFIGKITAPSETSNDLGTDEWGFAIQVDAFKRIGRFTPIGYLGRKFYTGEILNDRFYASVGSSMRISNRVDIGLTYDWSESTTDRLPSAHELFPFAILRIGGGLSLGPYAVIGLSNGSPDFGIGFSLKLKRASTASGESGTE